MSNVQAQTKPQMLEYYFTVKQSFKYDGRIYQPGEQWEPGGFPFDAKIIQNGKKVQRVESVIEAAEAARRPAKERILNPIREIEWPYEALGMEKPEVPDRLICPHCGRDNFKAQNGLTRHINMMHSEATNG